MCSTIVRKIQNSTKFGVDIELKFCNLMCEGGIFGYSKARKMKDATKCIVRFWVRARIVKFAFDGTVGE